MKGDIRVNGESEGDANKGDRWKQMICLKGAAEKQKKVLFSPSTKCRRNFTGFDKKKCFSDKFRHML